MDHDHHEKNLREEPTISSLIGIILRRSAVSVLLQSPTLSANKPHGARKFLEPACKYGRMGGRVLLAPSARLDDDATVLTI